SSPRALRTTSGPFGISGEEWQTKLTAFFTALPEKDHKCFEAIEGGDYKGYSPVKHDFYNTVVEVSKAAIGG
ncbi:hypothetical protein ACC806_38050, partial [Rhizobium ruizarguesonis]